VKEHPYFKGSDEIIKNIQNYKRQYYGYWYGGERKIFVYFSNSVPKSRKEDNLPIAIKEGFYKLQIKYSIDHDSLYDLSAEDSPSE
jgi:hypothetical protein